jgi:hypothetical protein
MTQIGLGSCGHDNPEWAFFCRECGRPLDDGPPAAAAAPSGPPAGPAMTTPPKFAASWPDSPPDGNAHRAPATSDKGLTATGPAKRLTAQHLMIGVAGSLALVVLFAVVLVSGSSHPPSPSQVQNLGPVVTTSDDQMLQSTVAQLSHYVERARGLTFLHPVKATLLNDADFDAHLRALGAGRLDANELGSIATFKALGVIPADYDPTKTPQSTSGVLGFYDPKTKELAVRGAYASVYVRKTLVHELTHALQDQRFDLRRIMSAGVTNYDQYLAEQALVEGDARRVESGYTSTLSPAEQDLLEREARKRGDEEYPAGFLLGFQSFPYVVGNHFAMNLITAGGQAALDKAFAQPPLSTKHILQLRAYLGGDNPIAVPAPPADGPVVSQGTLGEFPLVYVLAQVMSVSDAATLSAGWGGDAYVTWATAKGSCTRLRLMTEGQFGSSDMLAALQAWASTAPGRTVGGNNPITVTACV